MLVGARHKAGAGPECQLSRLDCAARWLAGSVAPGPDHRGGGDVALWLGGLQGRVQPMRRSGGPELCGSSTATAVAGETLATWHYAASGSGEVAASSVARARPEIRATASAQRVRKMAIAGACAAVTCARLRGQQQHRRIAGRVNADASAVLDGPGQRVKCPRKISPTRKGRGQPDAGRWCRGSWVGLLW